MKAAGPFLSFVLALALPCLCVAIPARAEPIAPDAALAAARPAPDGSQLIAATEAADGLLDMRVHSTAMNADIDLKVLRAPDDSMPAPVLYLLNGAGGGSDASSWPEQTDIVDFFHDKQVTLVNPLGGNGSYFTDWQRDDPLLGRVRWSTFLTEELPPIIDSALNGNGANAIAGISMAGTSVFQLALDAPGLYRAIGSYSGCARTSDPLGRVFVDAVVLRWHGDPANMWGPPDDPAWPAKDPYLHADRLRGTAIYVSSGTGVPGPQDTLDGTGIHGNAAKLLAQLASGGFLEAITDQCARSLRDRLQILDIPATFNLRPNGTHSWGYWQQDLHDSWPLFEQALRG
ncbi:esterase family protein [Nocardia sp. NBC_01503]|uniref:alpha/beta hydrolase n=1 Tax=Nocardia sp. NBC_01503 TaxID=2975997 RepID=UPI002E7B0D29|nr:alpha/beta hydrolase family protein [Nocardia sp. NBC_01503]WTL29720.1 esterase family protein [Nocardia sp. NBC_01503]